MSDDTKPVVSKEDTVDRLDIRLGQVLEVQVEPSAPKRAYRLTVDFGQFGTRTSVGRFTGHAPEEIKGKKVLGVLNFAPRTIGAVVSEVLIRLEAEDAGREPGVESLPSRRLGRRSRTGFLRC